MCRPVGGVFAPRDDAGPADGTKSHDQQGTQRPANDFQKFSHAVNQSYIALSNLMEGPVYARALTRNCDAVVLGCTEIPLLISATDSPLPVIDSTRTLARAALREAAARAIV